MTFNISPNMTGSSRSLPDSGKWSGLVRRDGVKGLNSSMNVKPPRRSLLSVVGLEDKVSLTGTGASVSDPEYGRSYQ